MSKLPIASLIGGRGNNNRSSRGHGGRIPRLSSGRGGRIPSLSSGHGGRIPSLSGGHGGTVPSLSGGRGGPIPNLSSGRGGPVPRFLGGRDGPVPSLSGGRGGSTIGLLGGCSDSVQGPSSSLHGYSLGLSGGQSGSPRGSIGVRSGPPPRLPQSWMIPLESVSEMVDIADDRIFLTCHGKNKIFLPSASVKISKIFKADIQDGAWCWKNVKEETRKNYFEEFKTMFKWSKNNEGHVHETFPYTLQMRYKNTMSKASRSTTKPKYLKDAQWTAFRAVWNTDEQMDISKQNSSNRCRGDEGPCTHTGGSKSYLQHAIDLKNKHPDKKDPSHCELFVHTHKKDDGSFVDEKSSSVNAMVNAEILKLSQRQEGCSDPSVIDHDEVYLKIVGGVKKGNVYGIGSRACTINMDSNPSCLIPDTNLGDLQTDVESLREELHLMKKARTEEISDDVKEAFLAFVESLGPNFPYVQPGSTSSPNESVD